MEKFNYKVISNEPKNHNKIFNLYQYHYENFKKINSIDLFLFKNYNRIIFISIIIFKNYLNMYSKKY